MNILKIVFAIDAMFFAVACAQEDATSELPYCADDPSPDETQDVSRCQPRPTAADPFEGINPTPFLSILTFNEIIEFL